MKCVINSKPKLQGSGSELYVAHKAQTFFFWQKVPNAKGISRYIFISLLLFLFQYLEIDNLFHVITISTSLFNNYAEFLRVFKHCHGYYKWQMLDVWNS